LEAEGPLVVTIKRGILCRDRGEFEKAEMILHAAIKLSRDMIDFKAETYIYNLLADIALEQVDYNKAERLYKEVLQRALSTGTTQNDEAILDISLKLVKIYEANRDWEKVNEGYTFVLHHQRNRIKPIKLDDGHELSDEEKNSLTLYSMVLDSLSNHHYERGNYEKAVRVVREAIGYSSAATGRLGRETIRLINNAGVFSEVGGNIKGAIEFFEEAVLRAKEAELEHMYVYLVNLGMASLRANDPQTALAACQQTFQAMTSMTASDLDRPLRSRAMECRKLAQLLMKNGELPPDIVLKLERKRNLHSK
jgi:tetratricopeptide repeat protein 19